jgi:microcystin-dependent protein
MTTILTFNSNKLNISSDMQCGSIQANTLNTSNLLASAIQSTTIQSNTLNTSNLLTNNITNAGVIQSNSINLQDNLYVNSNAYFPTGSVLSFAGVNAPVGWLVCNGTEVSKTTYANLFNVIGNMYGSAANPSNFVLPNLAEKMPIGKSGSNNIGDVGGASTVTLSVDKLPAHTHTGTTAIAGSHNHSINDPGHSHSQITHQDDYNNGGGNPPGFTGDGGFGNDIYWNNINSSTTGISINSAGDHTHSFTTNATGNGNPVDIRNKFVVLNYIIRY